MNRTIRIATRHLLCGLCVLFASSTQASLLGSTADISFVSNSTGQAFDDTGIFIQFSVEIKANDGSNVGGTPGVLDPGPPTVFIPPIPGAMASELGQNEYIDIGDDYVEFNLFGGVDFFGDCGTLGASCSSSQYPSDSIYTIDFSSNASNPLALFDPNPVINRTNLLGGSITVGLDFISLSPGGILVGPASNFGLLRLDFSEAPPQVIPVPAALPLMLSGLALIGFLARRRAS